jgi:hypothetical protein
LALQQYDYSFLTTENAFRMFSMFPCSARILTKVARVTPAAFLKEGEEKVMELIPNAIIAEERTNKSNALRYLVSYKDLGPEFNQ